MSLDHKKMMILDAATSGSFSKTELWNRYEGSVKPSDFISLLADCGFSRGDETTMRAACRRKIISAADPEEMSLFMDRDITQAYFGTGAYSDENISEIIRHADEDHLTDVCIVITRSSPSGRSFSRITEVIDAIERRSAEKDQSKIPDMSLDI